MCICLHLHAYVCSVWAENMKKRFLVHSYEVFMYMLHMGKSTHKNGDKIYEQNSSTFPDSFSWRKKKWHRNLYAWFYFSKNKGCLHIFVNARMCLYTYEKRHERIYTSLLTVVILWHWGRGQRLLFILELFHLLQPVPTIWKFIKHLKKKGGGLGKKQKTMTTLQFCESHIPNWWEFHMQ